jgi:hypothetical protein
LAAQIAEPATTRQKVDANYARLQEFFSARTARTSRVLVSKTAVKEVRSGIIGATNERGNPFRSPSSPELRSVHPRAS